MSEAVPQDLGRPLGTTTPAFFFEDPGERTEGVCLYLDGMSQALHGDPETRRRARQIREELRARGYEVIALTVTQLADEGAMTTAFRRLARILIERERATAIAEDTSWFATAPAPPPPTEPDGWDAIIEVMEPSWRPLGQALRDAGVPTPDDAEWDLVIEGRVTDARAILVWRTRVPVVALVAAAGPSVDGVTVVSADADVAETVARVRAALGGGA